MHQLETETWILFCEFPAYFVIFLYCVCVAMADACHPRTRRVMLRFANPFGCVLFLIVSLFLRLPGAEKSKGLRTLWAVGSETVTNMDVTAKFSLVLLLFLARASWSAWRHPNLLALHRANIVLMSAEALRHEPVQVWLESESAGPHHQNSPSGKGIYELDGDCDDDNGNHWQP